MDGTLVETENVTAQTAQKETDDLPKKTLDFFNGDEIRARVFYEKYVLKDQNDKPLEYVPEDMWKRLAREISGIESTEEKRTEWNEKFLWLMQDFKFVPGGRIMFGAGRKLRVTLLNCYVIPIRSDSIEAIFDWCKEAARTYSFGGGVRHRHRRAQAQRI